LLSAADSAVEEEALVSQTGLGGGKSLHRRDSLRSEKILQDRLFASIDVMWNNAIEIVGKQNPPSVTHVMLKNTKRVL